MKQLQLYTDDSCRIINQNLLTFFLNVYITSTYDKLTALSCLLHLNSASGEERQTSVSEGGHDGRFVDICEDFGEHERLSHGRQGSGGSQLQDHGSVAQARHAVGKDSVENEANVQRL